MDADKAITATFSEIVTPPMTYTLSVDVVGQGTVAPAGGVYTEGEVIALEATPDAGWQFDAWSGDLITTTNPISLTMDADKAISATFSEIVTPPMTYTLSVNVVGQGTVAPASGVYTEGEVITLEATPDVGWQFDAWSGDLIATTNLVSLTMNADKAITATFSEIITPPMTYTLSVDVVGQGTVAPESGAYTEGEVIALEATPDVGWQFDAWSGDLLTTTNPVNLTMDGDKAITATFREIVAPPPMTYTLSVDVVGSGSVAPTGGVYTEGEVIALEATPDAGWQFAGWSGDLLTTTNPVSLTMDGDKMVTATFSESTVNRPPTANAGDDQKVNAGEEVLLDGSLSADLDGDALTYRWRQAGGPKVTLTSRLNLSRTTFIAPESATVLTFTLTVTDTGGLSDGDEVVITVEELTYAVFLPLVRRE